MTTAAHIEALLRARLGLDAAALGTGTLERALRERRVAVGVNDLPAYWNLLHSTPDEFQSLIEAVVVPETWFFRHREALLALARFAAQRVSDDSSRLLRVLSLPCSSGEEPYSIAMALLDAGIPPGRFRVDAVDVSARALERARAGAYGINSFRGAPLDFRDRYFKPCAGGFTLDARVRQQVRLQLGNLVDPNLLAGEAPYDFVFCRNLLIYFGTDVQKRAVGTLERLTAPDGMIFVGPAEASVLSAQGLIAAGVPLAFAFCRPMRDAGPGRPAGELPPPPTPSIRTGSPALSHQAVPWRRTPQITRQIPAQRLTARARGTRQDEFSRISALADRGELDQATAACKALIEQNGPSAGACCLLGVLHDAAGRTSDAREAYRRALYLEPGHQEALHHLAALFDSEGDHEGAARLRQRAQRHSRTIHG